MLHLRDRVANADLMATGALISGRRTYELAGGWGGDHHRGVPTLRYRIVPGPVT